MRFSWSREPWGYALRDGNGAPHVLLTRNAQGWFAALIAPKFPSNGPHKAIAAAANQAEAMLRRAGVMQKGDPVSEVPYKRGQR